MVPKSMLIPLLLVMVTFLKLTLFSNISPSSWLQWLLLGADDYKAYRYNSDKTLQWLKKKVSRRCQSFIKDNFLRIVHRTFYMLEWWYCQWHRLLRHWQYWATIHHCFATLDWWTVPMLDGSNNLPCYFSVIVLD